MNIEIRRAIKVMQEQPGFYLVTDSTKTPPEVTIVAAYGGKIYAMRIQEEMDPDRFNNAANITGPILPQFRKPA